MKKLRIPQGRRANQGAPVEAARGRVAEQLFERGLQNSDRGDIAGAVRDFSEFVRLRPDTPEGHFNLARALLQLQRRAAAIEHLRRAVALKPDYRKAITVLAHTLQASGDLEGAIASFEQACRLAPDDHRIICDLAGALGSVRRDQQAAAMYRRAIELAPHVASLHYNFGNFVRQREGDDGAVAHYQRAVEQDPGHVRAWTNMGLCHKRKRPLQALRCFEEATARDPNHVMAVSELLSIHRRYCDFDAKDACQARLTAVLQGPGFSAMDWKLAKGILYSHLFVPLPNGIRSRLRELIATDLNLKQEAGFERTGRTPAAARLDNKPLRVGYLSPSFGNHPVGQVTLSLFGAHDRRRVEAHGLSTHKDGPDGSDYARMHRERFQHFHEIGGMSPRRAAEYIQALGIDILVTLDGYMDDNALPILALRPAPLQVFWLGHADRLGLPFIDYVIADEQVMPRAESDDAGEAVIRLPGTYHCADRHPVADDCPPRSAWELPEQGVVYCVFNNPEKIDRTIMDCWLRILAAVEGSVLWFSPFRQDESLLLATLRRYAAGHGIAPERLILTKRVPGKDLHLARLAHADLMLDTVTLNASTTALDGLWAGVPLLAVRGDRFSNRISGSMLRALGLEDLICSDIAEYERRAIELGRDPSAREALRQRLARSRETGPLFDVHRFARRLESAYETVWARHLQGMPPADVDAPDPFAERGAPAHPGVHGRATPS